METALFEEDQEVYLRRPLAALSAAAFFVIPLFAQMPLLLILGMFAAGIGISTLMSAFMKMRTRVTFSELSFGPPIWTKRFLSRDVEVVGIRDIPFMAGFGMHMYRGKMYYNARYGKALEVRKGKRSYVIGSARVEEFQAAMNEMKRNSHP